MTAADAEVRLVEPKEADLVLCVSNQLFDDEGVRVTVVNDDIVIVIVHGDFEDQDNWISLPLEVSLGDHTVTAEADSGAAMSEAFRISGDKSRFAVIDYWGKDDSATFSRLSPRQPIGFA